MKAVLLAVFIIICMALTSCSGDRGTGPKIERGEADFRTVSLVSVNRMLLLDGEWRFVPGEMIGPRQPFSDNRSGLVKVPLSWEMLPGMDGLREGTGFGTYRLQVLLHSADVGHTLGLQIGDVASAYRLWVNGRLLRSIGTAGQSADTSVPKETMEYVYFVPDSNVVQIDMQVSNFSQRKGGIWGSVYLGSEQALQSSVWRNMARECMAVGALLMMGLFYLAFALLYIPERSTLFLGLLSVLLAARILFLGQVLIAFLIPSLPWTWQVRLEYLIEIGAMLAVNEYVREMYPRQYSRRLINAVRFISLMFALIVVVTSSLFFTRWLVVHVSVIAATTLYAISFVYPQAVRQKQLGARSGLIALIIFLGSALNDSFYYLSLPLTSEELVYLGFFIYLLAQMAVSIRRYVQLKEQSDAMTLRLGEANERLEHKVKERTAQLTESYRSSSRLIHSIAHDIRSPIVLIRNQTKLLKPSIEPEGVVYLEAIEQQAEFAAKLAQNLNDLACLQENELQYCPVRLQAAELVKFIYKQTGTVVRSGGFRLTHKQLDELFDAEGLHVLADPLLIERVCGNIASNILNYAKPGGEVHLSYRLDGTTLEVWFDNESHPLPIETEERIFDRFYRGSLYGEGSGIGLSVSREIVRLHGGNLEVSQPEPDWVRFVLGLPLQPARSPKL